MLLKFRLIKLVQKNYNKLHYYLKTFKKQNCIKLNKIVVCRMF